MSVKNPWQQCLFENAFVRVKTTRHGVFAFNCNDRFIGRSLDLYGEWAESELALLRRFVVAGDTVLDVGANIGTHAVAFSRLTGDAGRVIAFEPQRSVFHLLCANVALNGLTNVECRRAALGETRGIAKISALSPRALRNFGAVTVGSGDGDEVEMTTIDALRLAACKLIKIDVEGMEPEVMRGARATIASHRPILYVENNTVGRAAPTLAEILAIGYCAWWDLALYYNPANFFGNPENVFSRYQPEANLLCMPPGMEPGVPELVECSGPDDNWKLALHRGIAARNPRFI